MKTIIAGTIVKGVLMQDKTEGSKAKGIWCLDDQLSEETQGKVSYVAHLNVDFGLKRVVKGNLNYEVTCLSQSQSL